jgi:hypothetical protein
MTDQRPETLDETRRGLSLEEMAQRVGGYQWLEMQTFELLGRWVQQVPEISVKVMLGTHCYHHSWHAELWQQRLPELRELDVARLVRPPSPQIAAVMTTLREADGAGLTIEKLAGAYRVLIPRKIGMYTDHLRVASPVADAALIRSLQFALADEMADWRDGELILQSLLRQPTDVTRAATYQARLETLLV